MKRKRKKRVLGLMSCMIALVIVGSGLLMYRNYTQQVTIERQEARYQKLSKEMKPSMPINKVLQVQTLAGQRQITLFLPRIKLVKRLISVKSKSTDQLIRLKQVCTKLPIHMVDKYKWQ